MIQTRRTNIRPLAKKDEQDLFEIYSQPGVFKNFGTGVYTQGQNTISVERAVEKWRDCGKGDLVAEYNKKVIARLILFTSEPAEFEIGYDLNPMFWRKGLGTEIASALMNYAFSEGASNVKACARETNIISIKILQKLGFEETHREIGQNSICRIWFESNTVYTDI